MYVIRVVKMEGGEVWNVIDGWEGRVKVGHVSDSYGWVGSGKVG